MTGQPFVTDRFVMFYVISVLTSLVSQSLGMLIGAASPQVEVNNENLDKIQKRNVLGSDVYGPCRLRSSSPFRWILHQRRDGSRLFKMVQLWQFCAICF